MPPVTNPTEAIQFVEDQISRHKVVVFSKSYCPFCKKIKSLFNRLGVEFEVIELDERDDGRAIQDALLNKTNQKTVPNVFVLGTHIGGCDSTLKAEREGQLSNLLGIKEGPSDKNNALPTEPKVEIEVAADGGAKTFDYDLVVVGGGSGGLAAAKRGLSHGATVALLDFVKPSPMGTTWGLGGTCVNVGCIPKKLMHQAALLHHNIEDAGSFGWSGLTPSHNWATMIKAIQNYIKSLNWSYRTEIVQLGAKYLNAFGEFVDKHTIRATNKKGVVTSVTGKYFILATGGRPRYPDIPGKEHAISSDDLFSLKEPPGKTVIVGASYISLECSGFLASLGFDVTVLVRSILLRGFDQDMAEMIGICTARYTGVRFVRPAIPVKIEKSEKEINGRKALAVTYKMLNGGNETTEYFNTVMFAIGRDPCTNQLGVQNLKMKLNPKNGKVIAPGEQTSVKNIFAIGDIVDGRPELTPVAIQAGKLLSNRLFGGATEQMDYRFIATTVFTPIEYGCIGYSEEAAIEEFVIEDLKIFYKTFTPLEWTLPKRGQEDGYMKLICKGSKQTIIGFHYLGPNAGEITQGYAVAVLMGATKHDFDRTVGIHPTCSEWFTTLTSFKGDGKEEVTGGC